MRVGLVLHAVAGSVKHVMASVRSALAEDHELVYLHPGSAHVSDEERHRLAGEFVEACDAIVGVIDTAVLTMRQRLGSTVPYFLLVLGTMPRGAFRLRPYLPQIHKNDTLIVNCEADRRICQLFFGDAHLPIVPLAYDDRAFRPITDEERAVIREELGFGEGARVLIYAGRVTPEKNLHGVLRVFRLLLERVPELHLVIAGRIVAAPFTEFGVSPTAFPETLASISTKLGIPPERVLYAGPVPAEELRELYGVADLAINLTLHHDENFGLAQVEAMACGLPVVGSMWGGLKDTISEGRTGYRAATLATPLGVKLDWWDAANRCLEILEDPTARMRFREAGPLRASRQYSQGRLRDRLSAVIDERTAAAPESPTEPLGITDFARDFWATCDPDTDRRSPFRRGRRAMDLYRRMIEPFTGLSAASIPASEPLRPEQLVYLAVPVAVGDGGALLPDDPLYPLECEVPAELGAGVRAVLGALGERPVMTVGRVSEGGPQVERALPWMVEQGLLLRSDPRYARIPLASVPRELSVALFDFRRLPEGGADFVVSD